MAPDTVTVAFVVAAAAVAADAAGAAASADAAQTLIRLAAHRCCCRDHTQRVRPHDDFNVQGAKLSMSRARWQPEGLHDDPSLRSAKGPNSLFSSFRHAGGPLHTSRAHCPCSISTHQGCVSDQNPHFVLRRRSL
jgi:hypothetical protein